MQNSKLFILTRKEESYSSSILKCGLHKVTFPKSTVWNIEKKITWRKRSLTGPQMIRANVSSYSYVDSKVV